MSKDYVVTLSLGESKYRMYAIATCQGSQLPQSKDVGLVTHDLTVSGNNATLLLPHYTWLHHWVVDNAHLTNTFTH